MVRITRVYTKKGDGGETRLASGELLPKDHPRVESYGAVDELNSLIGIVRYFNLQKRRSKKRDNLDLILETIQHRLFDLGGELATRPGSKRKDRLSISEANVRWLENVIDAMNAELKPLKSFTLPGGGPVNSFLHQCRTVCRRAERQIVKLRRQEEIGPSVLPYINRLSDALYVIGRWVGFTFKEKEFLWEPAKNDPADWRWGKWKSKGR